MRTLPLKLPMPARHVAGFVVLVLAGLLGNYLKFPLFLNIEFIFGSIFAMLALQMFGLGAGILAGALVSSYTLLLWNHPYFALIATAELVVVGILFRRYRIGLVLADALFWIALGLPLTYVFYHSVMGVPLTNTSLVMSKVAVNGIVNALLARLLYTWGALQWRGVLLQYRDLTYNFLALFALLPAISLLAVQGRIDFAETDQAIRSELRTDGLRMSLSTEAWIENRMAPVVHLASIAATRAPDQMQAALEQARATDANFLRISLVDQAATSVAVAPRLDQGGQPNAGRSYADRPFIPSLRSLRKPMLSEVVLSRVSSTPLPIVLALAPVVQGQDYAGFVAGVLSLERVDALFQRNTQTGGLRYTLLDQRGNVILTNVPDQKAMTPFKRSAGKLSPPIDGIAQWVPAVAAGAPIMERWRSSFYVSETQVGPMGEWRLILERPVAPFQKLLFERYARSLGFLLLILLVALVLAEVSSRGSMRSLLSLSLMTQALPSRLMAGAEPVVWPGTKVAETQQLISNFKHMGDSLLTQFAAITHSNEGLESRVAARTAELQDSLRDRDALLKEVHHRVKNNLQVIASLLRLEARRSSQANTRAVLGDMQGRIYAMAQLHQSLYRSGTFASVDLGAYLGEIATKAFGVQLAAHQQVRLTLELEPVPAGMDQAIACGLLVNEWVSNCMKHAFAADQPGAVVVQFKPDDVPGAAASGLWRLSVSDSGVGLPEGLVESSNTSLGLQLAGDLCLQLGGSLGMQSQPGAGATFFVVFRVLAVSPLVMPV